jgi:hypothetical protein
MKSIKMSFGEFAPVTAQVYFWGVEKGVALSVAY